MWGRDARCFTREKRIQRGEGHAIGIYVPHLKTAASGEEMHGQRRVEVLLLLLENFELFGLQLPRLGIGCYSVKQLCVELPRQALLHRTESWHQTSEI